MLHFAQRHEQQVKRALKHTVNRTVPATPAANKWTKLAPVCDLLILGFLVHGVFVKTFAALGVAHDENALRLDSNLDFDMIKEALFLPSLAAAIRRPWNFSMTLVAALRW